MSHTKPGASDPAQEDRLAELLASFDEMLKTGASDARDAATSHDVSGAIPPELHRAQDCLRLLEAVFPRCAVIQPTRRLAGAEVTSVRPGAVAPAQVGRFAVCATLGRGGFGTVYLAVDTHLGREVALKIPHADTLADPELRARFHHEAQAAARLDHPNIVQVYEAGESGSVAYIALAYCPGITLAEWLMHHVESVSPGAAAQLLATLARAVEHAHRQGIIHRDLKPANVLLSVARDPAPASAMHQSRPPSSTTSLLPLSAFVPKITDFGLAKHLDSTTSYSKTGAIVGTPAYMAPEQTGTKRAAVGPAADVFSLGAVLYEVLTRRPPFQGETVLDTLQQVRFQDPLSPRRLRPGLPRDLETICLKCLEKEPAKRYVDAGALAADLKRYVDGKPILARPVGAAGRAWRWCRRKPVVAALTLALVVALLGGFAAVFSQWRRAELHAKTAETTAANLKIADMRALEEWKRAERHLGQARDLVDALTKLGNELRLRPELNATGRLLLEKSLAFYQAVLVDKSNDPALRFEASLAYSRVGAIRMWLGQWHGAKAAYEEQAELLTGLIANDPQRHDYGYDLMYALNNLGALYRDVGRRDAAHSQYERATAIGEHLIAQPKSRLLYRVGLANIIENHATVLEGPGKAEQQEKMLHRALTLITPAVEDSPSNPIYRAELALCLDDLGMHLFWSNKNRAESESAVRRSLQLRQELRATGDIEVRYLARSHNRLAQIIATHQPEEAERHFREGIGILEKVSLEFPGAQFYRRDLIDANFRLGWFLMQQDRLDEAVVGFSTCTQHYERLARDMPQRLEYAAYADVHRLNLVLLHLMQRRYEDAARLLGRSLGGLWNTVSIARPAPKGTPAPVASRQGRLSGSGDQHDP